MASVTGVQFDATLSSQDTGKWIMHTRYTPGFSIAEIGENPEHPYEAKVTLLGDPPSHPILGVKTQPVTVQDNGTVKTLKMTVPNGDMIAAATGSAPAHRADLRIKVQITDKFGGNEVPDDTETKGFQLWVGDI
jgi:hypothetical protein